MLLDLSLTVNHEYASAVRDRIHPARTKNKPVIRSSSSSKFVASYRIRRPAPHREERNIGSKDPSAVHTVTSQWRVQRTVQSEKGNGGIGAATSQSGARWDVLSGGSKLRL